MDHKHEKMKTPKFRERINISSRHYTYFLFLKILKSVVVSKFTMTTIVKNS
jgi:hypothetical protein